jgi:hypothetical protein
MQIKIEVLKYYKRGYTKLEISNFLNIPVSVVRSILK